MQLSFKKDGVPEGSIALSDLRENDEARIDSIDLPDELAHRLMELGFLPGHKVQAGRAAPGGDPRVFRVDGTEIALRRDTAEHIVVSGPSAARVS